MKTKAIFRKWPKSKGGDVIALFPQEPGTNDPWTCLSYQHIGQHGPATIDLARTLPLATRTEYAPLARELRRIGYKLDIRKRITAHDLTIRKEQLK